MINDNAAKYIIINDEISDTEKSEKIKKISHEPFMQDVLSSFNNKSYNQAYIQAELSKDTHEITLKKTEFLNKYLIEI
ncbi:MAG: hypothetical protein LBI03_08525, partial [Clostridiales bacterium]|nr:hypothetical protein [Clostridiales bacterium]